jgi:ABC-type nitrate/sulfonate/bicarbonate transport system permease component
MTTKQLQSWFDGISLSNISWTPRLIGVVGFFVIWTALASVFPAQLMPYPFETGQIVIELIVSGEALPEVQATLFRTILGFVGALAVAMFVGVSMGLNDFSEKLFTPWTILGLAMPALVWGALATLTIGYNNITIVVATVLTVAPFLILPIWKGVENIDYDLMDMARSFEVSNGRLIRKIVIPSILPAFVSTVRLAVATSWNIVIIGELLAANNGVGSALINTYRQYQYEEAWAWAALFMLLILAVEYLILKPLERRVFSYRVEYDFDMIR